MDGLLLRYLAYLGPDRLPADLEFKAGLNVVCGASETGKSLVGETIDFMLGQKGPMREVPEREGYDRIRLALEGGDYPPLTVERSTEGGNFLGFEGLALADGSQSAGRVLRWQHSRARKDTLSFELLQRAGLGSKFIRTNKAGKTRSLSFRDLARLCIVTEGEIQKRESPIVTGQYTSATAEYATFKLLLTGTDDSALVAVDQPPARRDHRSGKIELLEEQIQEIRSEIEEEGLDEDELKGQLAKIQGVLGEQQQQLASVKRQLDTLLEQRGALASEIQRRNERLQEIEELEKRFGLLSAHYETDLRRLRAIHESGSLFVYLDRTSCPLCGALPEDQHLSSSCDGNTEAVVLAAEAEMHKIECLRHELKDTLVELSAERDELSRELVSVRQNYEVVDKDLSDVVAPAMSEGRTSYAEVMSEREVVRMALTKFDRMWDLIRQKAELEASEEGAKNKDASPTQIGKKVLDEFSQTVERILQEWHFPGAQRVFFDESERDLQISGKSRGNTGKGLRAITHAAVTIGLMEFCSERGLPHPGFVVLDSPLLAYWKPEGEEDDLRGTDLDEMFYRYLLGLSDENQVIVLENKHPPDFVFEEAAVTVFTKNPHKGRYGLFPDWG